MIASRPLDQQLCFTLYATSIAINRLYKPLLDRIGITYPQLLVLHALSEEDGRTIGGIAARLSLESSTITPLVKRMAATGLVTRSRDSADERQVRVALTDRGVAVIAESGCLGEALVTKAGVSLDALDALNEQVGALRAALTADDAR